MTKHVLNGIGHFDIAGPDLVPLKSFYEGLFGWTITERGPGYALATTPEGTPNGALLEAETAALTIGIVVENLEQSLKTAVARGGEIAMPLTDNGWVKKAQVRDPAGNLLTLIEG